MQASHFKILVFSGISMAAILVLAVSSSPLKELKDQKVSFTYAASIIESAVRTDPEKGYRDLKSALKDASPERKHELAHTFGELLYEAAGVSGLGVCDSAFTSGCEHGFFLKAFAERGVADLKTFDNVCEERRWEKDRLLCQHGIGHGILAFLGKDALFSALELCEKIKWYSAYGCTSGVFMEYNFPDDHLDEYLEIRPLDEKGFHFPCSAITETFIEGCYLEQPQWWGEVAGRDAAELSSLCFEVSPKKFRDTCFRGVGFHSVAWSEFNLKKTVAFCASLSSNEIIELCKEGASRSFLSVTKSGRKAKKMCESLLSEARVACFERINQYEL